MTEKGKIELQITDKTEFGEDSLPDEMFDSSEFGPEHSKVRITTFIDMRAKTELQRIAKIQGTKYQTLLSDILNNVLFDKAGNPRNDVSDDPAIVVSESREKFAELSKSVEWLMTEVKKLRSERTPKETMESLRD